MVMMVSPTEVGEDEVDPTPTLLYGEAPYVEGESPRGELVTARTRT